MERDWRPGGVIQHQHPAQYKPNTTQLFYTAQTSMDGLGLKSFSGENPRLVLYTSS